MTGTGATSAATVIRRLRCELQALSAAGLQQVPIAQFEEWFEGLEELSNREPETFEIVLSERFKANTDLVLASLKTRSQQDLELLRSLVSTAGAATKASLLINGGSAVALLAFIGHLVTTGHTAQSRAFAFPLGSFALGVFFAAFASSLIYLVQWHFYHKKNVGTVRWPAIALQAFSFVAFLIGCVLSLLGFLSLGEWPT